MASFFFTRDESVRIDTSEVAGAQVVSARAHRQGAVRSIKQGMPGFSGASGLRRAELAPPSMFSRSRPLWRTWVNQFWCWLWDMDELPRSAAPTSGLGKLKSEFTSALWDLQSLQANLVRDQIEQARSLRELWHLRAQVFKAISTHRGQMEAQLRLDGLDAHFPVRSSRRPDEARSGKSSTW